MKANIYVLLIGIITVATGISTHGLTEHVDPRTGARWYSRPASQNLSSNDMKRFACSRFESPEEKAKRITLSKRTTSVALPESFSARDKWPQCKTITEIRDQSNCRSCWAMGAVTAMSDRYCIATNETIRLSTLNLVSCCKDCGWGCDGGWPNKAWDYWRDVGIVTEECQPYPFEPCAHTFEEKDYKPCKQSVPKTPECSKLCGGMKYPTKYKSKQSYNLATTEKIMEDIMEHGPVEATFEVYEDFLTYQTGVYFHRSGVLIGAHAVRIVGWGKTEQNVPYWEVANSLNNEWGENGYVRFLRGVNECKIEEDVVAGTV